MRRLMISQFITLDGVIEAPGGEPGHPHSGWVIPFAGAGLEPYKDREIHEASAMLLGRVQYQEFAEAWMPRTGAMAERLAALPKYVATSTLTDPLTWNARILDGDVTTAITALKQEDGGPILVHGSATLCRNLLRADLVDDLRLMIFPVTVGGGKTIYPDGFTLRSFELVEQEIVDPSVIVLTYARKDLPTSAWEFSDS